MLRAFHDALGDSWKSTVQLLTEGKQIAYGAIVDSDGWIVTKASQLPEKAEIRCRMYDGRDSVVSIVDRIDDLDLALLRVPESQLTPVVWDSGPIPRRGNWLATTDTRTTPIAVGVVSAGTQSIHKSDPVLGVVLEDSSLGSAVREVLVGTGAYDAGIRVGDNIFAINGKELKVKDEVLAAIKSYRAGEVIRVGVERGSRRFEAEAQLMDLTHELRDPTEIEVNGRVSARATNFKRVFSHDTVLQPHECGGPLVSLDGKVVGINIARAGRVSSYALPVDVVRPVVENLVAQQKLVSRQGQDQSNLRPVR